MPPPRRTYIDTTDESRNQTMLEDESGRLRLTGALLQDSVLVTGAIVAVLGTENADGNFEVINIQVPDLPPQPERWERDTESTITATGKRKREDPSGAARKKIAFISGLDITGTSADSVTLSLLADYLLGYGDAGDYAQGSGATPPSQISRLIIAGNSLGASTASAEEDLADDEPPSKKKRESTKKYGYDAAAYNPSPINHLDTLLAEILPSIPVTLMPGEQDPANFSLPQQEIHRAMFPRSKAYCSAARPGQGGSSAEPGWLDCVTNPWQGDVEGWRFWGCSGQNVDDVLRYINIDDEAGDPADRDGNARIRLMESMLRWRCAVPTAPDTICGFPFPQNSCLAAVQSLLSLVRYSLTCLIRRQGAIRSKTTIPSFSRLALMSSSLGISLSSVPRSLVEALLNLPMKTALKSDF
jgi:DNA polymerase delta subunit 2